MALIGQGELTKPIFDNKVLKAYKDQSTICKNGSRYHFEKNVNKIKFNFCGRLII
jgi:hypothetical protein